jgi:hypothetical protein
MAARATTERSIAWRKYVSKGMREGLIAENHLLVVEG